MVTVAARTIISRSVYLRKIDQSCDLPILLKWRNDNNFIRLCSTRRNKVTAEQFIRELSLDFAHDRHLQYLIIRLSDDVPLGTIYDYNYNQTDKHAFVTIFICDEFESMGYGAEAFGIFCHHLFNVYSLYKIYVEVYAYNEHSLKCLKGGGFVEEGRFKGHRWLGGQRFDLIRLALFAPAHRLNDFVRRLTRQ